MRRQSASEPPGDELDERRVGEDETIADGAVARPPVLLPERARVLGLRHKGRIRRDPAISSSDL